MQSQNLLTVSLKLLFHFTKGIALHASRIWNQLLNANCVKCKLHFKSHHEVVEMDNHRAVKKATKTNEKLQAQ